MKSKKIIISLIIAGIVIVSIIMFNFLYISKDQIKTNTFKEEFLCDNNNNYIDYQLDNECSAYAAAYVLRYYGESISGQELYPEVKRTFGFVFPKNVINVFKEKGYAAKTYRGNFNTLKERLNCNAPVIAFISSGNDTHYVVVVGYDTEYVYLVDSLLENKNINNELYNRKITINEFEKIWKTNTILPNNVYIVIDK